VVSIFNFNNTVGKPVVVSEKIFPALECAIVFVMGCLAFVSFHPSSLVQSYRRR